MRKRYKLKKRSCALCKPWKMHWQNRWKPKEFARLQAFEQVYHRGEMSEPGFTCRDRDIYSSEEG
jgi:hypothetical protein